MKSLAGILVLVLVLSSCNSGPKAIAYGSEGCHFCSMTIVDKQHAAQFMTKKGRSYSFDASECMLNYMRDIDLETVALYRVNNYTDPGVFVDATKATYLISENIPSPMGAFLTAFSNEEEAKRAQLNNSGTLYTWPELKNQFEKDNPF
ncbi:nitrous oxide reductase accessory protein NosL [Zobellia uliginosa]|uniref:nitrous oxide reductase accessory protein NosL n=1 Tax=Zobellia uliginosa TaxID=143224 RepID=UPI001C0756B8|nr:nitrous oxide reductase accessory protein NosL [Zobellia uliginosa]MBU2947764.1 nitrous oxide reductase accessory protein NosL [Zobellia uliginosa]